MKPSFEVQPQRSDGRGYIPCEPHQATSFALVKTVKFTRQGKKFKTSRVIERFTTRNQAEGAKHLNEQSHLKVLGYKLGRRIMKEKVQ